MSDTSQGPGWWIASDGKWYPPESAQPATPPPPTPPAYMAPPVYSQPVYAQPVYSQPTMGYSVPTAPEALWSMILGIASLVCCGLVLGIPAIILGSNAKKKIASAGGALGGEGMAKAGVIMGWISVGFSVLAFAFWLILILGSSISSGY